MWIFLPQEGAIFSRNSRKEEMAQLGNILPIMDRMLMFSQDSYVESLIPNVMVFEGRFLER